MDHWEQTVRAAIAERRQQLESITREAAEIERQIAAQRQRLDGLVANRSALEHEVALLEKVAASAESASAGGYSAPASAEMPPVSGNGKGAPSKRPKGDALLNALRSFGRSGAHVQEVANVCTRSGVEMKRSWASSYLSQMKKRGEVVTENGLWWVPEHAPVGVLPVVDLVPKGSFREFVLKVVSEFGERGASQFEITNRIREVRPSTNAGAVASSLSSMQRAHLISLDNNRFVAGRP